MKNDIETKTRNTFHFVSDLSETQALAAESDESVIKCEGYMV